MRYEKDEERDFSERAGDAAQFEPYTTDIVPSVTYLGHTPFHHTTYNSLMNRKVKIRQLDKQDCAAACLASVASHYGLNIPITVIRQKCGTTTEGTNIKGILDAAITLSMDARAYKSSSPCYNIKHLSGIPLPSILHFRNSDGWLHFVVLYKVTDRHIVIMDPSDGEFHKIGQDEFKDLWTGYLITITPSSEFHKGDHSTPLLARMYELIHLHRDEILPALAGSLTYVLTGLTISLFLQHTIDTIIPNRDISALLWYSLGFGTLILLSVFIGYIRSILIIRGGIKIDGTLIMKYMEHILHLPLPFFHQRSVGEINSRVNDVYRIRSFVSSKMIVIFISALAIVASFALLFTFYWKLAAMTLAFIPAYCAIYYFADRSNRKYNKRIIEASAVFDSTTIGAISSIEPIKNFAGEGYFLKQVEEKYTDMAQALYTGGKRNAGINAGMEFTTQILTFIIITAGTLLVLEGELSTGELVSFYSISGFFTSPLGVLIESTYELNDARVAAQRVFEILDLERDSPNGGTLPIPNNTEGKISLENISFKYPGKGSLFERFSAVIQPHKVTSITGGNGCGKSTLASLIMRNIKPQEGKILIDNLNIDLIDIETWRKYISIIPQQESLFQGSVLDNITMGENNPDMDKVLGICGAVGMIDFINTLPIGISSMVGERGKFLSGGERIKISLARALYRDPSVLILDEVTSHLDRESSQLIYQLVRRLADGGMTIINITHDNEFIECSDYIVNIDKCIHQGEWHHTRPLGPN